MNNAEERLEQKKIKALEGMAQQLSRINQNLVKINKNLEMIEDKL